MDGEHETCQLCLRRFTSYPAMRQHMRHAHPVEYNNEVQNAGINARKKWTDEEVEELATAEFEYRGEDLIVHLCSISGRSEEAIKKRRRAQEWQNVLWRLEHTQRAINEENHEDHMEEVMQEVEERLAEIERGPEIIEEDLIQVAPEQEGIIRPVVDDPVKQAILDLAPLLEDREDVELAASLCMNRDSKKALDDWTGVLIKKFGHIKQTVVRIENTVEIPNQSRRKMRAIRYRIFQNKWNKNRKTAANEIIDNMLDDNVKAKPNSEAIKTAYNSILTPISRADTEEFEPPEQTYNLYRPILPEEIQRVIYSSKQSAAGPDGITIQDIRRIPVRKLVLLFNAMLMLKYVPSSLRKSKTILIPKKKEHLENVNNWRPITISSLLLRFCNKIHADRLKEVPLHFGQRGFQQIDGVFANNISLHTIIKKKRKQLEPYCIIALDIKKAFDTVSHRSIARALRKKGLDDNTLEYIIANYQDSITTIFCEGEEVGSFEVNQGVKQGDPMSPVLFNIMMDELVEKLNSKKGVTLNGVNLSCMAYADDLILIAEQVRDARKLLLEGQKFFEKRNLELNVSKCAAVAVGRAPQKRLFTYTIPQFYLYGEPIKQIGVNETWQYLGEKFTFAGVSKCSIKNLKEQVNRILKAPLKTDQKLICIKNHLIPRYIHSLQSPTVHSATLTAADRILRWAVKKVLHLPSHLHSAALHAPIREGGIGIFSFRDKIPIIIKNRLEGLLDADPFLNQVLIEAKGWSARVEKLIKPRGATKITIDSLRSRELHESFHGGGLQEMKHHKASGHYLYDPPKYWSGEDLIRAVQLRTNTLPTRSLPYTPAQEAMCRAGCARRETLCHVLQKCPLMHWERLNRHNHIARKIKNIATKKGWQVEEEPHIRGEDGSLKKPDLLMVKGDQVVITDVAVCWEAPNPLGAAYRTKQFIYGGQEFLDKVREMYPDKVILVLPLIVGARGAWCAENKALVDAIKITVSEIKEVISSAMRGGWIIHQHFSRRVWRRPHGR